MYDLQQNGSIITVDTVASIIRFDLHDLIGYRVYEHVTVLTLAQSLLGSVDFNINVLNMSDALALCQQLSDLKILSLCHEGNPYKDRPVVIALPAQLIVDYRLRAIVAINIDFDNNLELIDANGSRQHDLCVVGIDSDAGGKDGTLRNALSKFLFESVNGNYWLFRYLDVTKESIDSRLVAMAAAEGNTTPLSAEDNGVAMVYDVMDAQIKALQDLADKAGEEA